MVSFRSDVYPPQHPCIWLRGARMLLASGSVLKCSENSLGLLNISLALALTREPLTDADAHFLVLLL